MSLRGVHAGARPCQSCGTWTCAACGWKRPGAALARPELQDCPRCGSTDGMMTPARHTVLRLWLDHNPAAGPPCPGWESYWLRPGLPCGHESCREVNRGSL